MSWKEILIQAKELLGKAGTTAFDRATLLVSVWNDPDFQADARSEFVALDRLSEYVNDLALNFLELQQLLVKFPTRDAWAKGNIRQMYDSMMRDKELQKSAAASRMTTTLTKTTPVSTHIPKDANAAVSTALDLATLRAENDRLKAENRELRLKNQEMQTKLRKLQAIVSKSQDLLLV
jgi:hypothetical protein